MPTARDFATYSEIPAAYFTLKEGDMTVLNTTILQKIGKCHNIAKTNSPKTAIDSGKGLENFGELEG